MARHPETTTEMATTPTPALPGNTGKLRHNQTTTISEQPEACDPQYPNDSPPGYQRVDAMTLETANTTQQLGPQRLLNTGPSPSAATQARPTNYVIRPDALGEEPEFVDCPWCCTRQKTKVSEQASSTTTILAVVCCLAGGCLCSMAALACNWCGDLQHECSGCGRPVARKPYDGKTEAITPPPSFSVQQGPITTSMYTPAPQGTR